MTVYVIQDALGLYLCDRMSPLGYSWTSQPAGAKQFLSMTAAALAVTEFDLGHVDVVPVDDESIDA